MHILFPALRALEILDCPQVESFSEGGLPRNVKVLFIKGSQKLVVSRREWGLHNHTCLQFLRIQDEEAECLPEPDLLPPTLTLLVIEGCFNLKTLDYNGLRHLSALQQLHLIVCPKLKCYPKEGLPTSIHTLHVMSCPKLKKRCQKKKGREWSNIAHIPLITFDDDVLTWIAESQGSSTSNWVASSVVNFEVKHLPSLNNISHLSFRWQTLINGAMDRQILLIFILRWWTQSAHLRL